ncbi:unnamed protein product [Acanthoscelides obtectus]|uniref:Odorant receptor n=2 Tax=Acanthoscelides obtectus TaxID=200917 RepID=A0A9P0PQE9_ACAOB|nr:unnamed protein product [Acanthoscelides obtectus]CAK1635397.1 hypothetical protein AOBTE_LOCUS9251 [Acanthoscelides obtectus]
MIDHVISTLRRKLQSMDLWSIINRSLFLMNMMGVHPAKVGSRVQSFVFFFLIINFCICSYWMAMFFFVKEDKDFIMFVMSLENVLCTVHATLYLSCLYIQRPSINQLLTEMRDKFWDISNYSDNDLVKAHEESVYRVNVKYVSFCLILFYTAVSFYYGRIVTDRKPIGANLVFESYLPEGMPFWVLFAWQHIPAVALVSLEVAMDFLICSILSLTAMQYRLLRYELERVFGDYPGKKEGEGVITTRSRRCNDQLTFLLGDSIEHMIKILLYSGFMFFEFFICFCYPAQDLTAGAEKLANSIYFSDWSEYPNHHREILLLLGKSQIRVVFTAGGLLEVDLKTGMAALKSVFSYSMFLRTMTMID